MNRPKSPPLRRLPGLKKLRPLLLLLGLLSLYCCRHEPTRQIFAQLRTVEDVQRMGKALVWPPWQLLRSYVSVEDDVHLYFEYTRVILGEDPDAAYIASWQATNDPRYVRQLHRGLTHKSGLRLPYRDVPIVLPPVALAVMLLPRLLTDTLAGYRIGFAVLMAALHLGALYGAWRLLRRLRSQPGTALASPSLSQADPQAFLFRAALATACLGPLLVGRYDALPSLFVVLALLQLTRGRALQSALLLLLGAGSKLFPLFLVPIWAAILLGQGRSQRRSLLSFLFPFALLAGVALWGLALRGKTPDVLLGALLLFGKRPIQIESLAGSLLRCLGSGLVFSYGSDNVQLSRFLWLPQAVDAVNVLLSLGLSVAAWLGSRRLPPADPVLLGRYLCHFTVAGLLLLIVSSKLLSPQYLVWVLPLLILLPSVAIDPTDSGTSAAQRTFGLYCLALGMTQVYFPFLFALVAQGVPVLLAWVLLRNLILLAALLSLLRPTAWLWPRLRPVQPSATTLAPLLPR